MLTASTDPASIMFEGHPDVTIKQIRPTGFGDSFYVYVGRVPDPDTFFGISRIYEGCNHAHKEDGSDTASNPRNIWPRIVPRFKFTTDKPIIATSNYGGTIYSYEYVGTYTPADGSEPVIHLRRTERDSGYGSEIRVYASTGKIVSGDSGSALTFSNGPKVKTYQDNLTDTGLVVNVTTTDGKITAISLA